MAKRCPQCGRFMTLVPAGDAGEDFWDCYMWLCCANDECLQYEEKPIPAPEYQWLWNCLGIPFEDLLDWPELLEEYTELWNRLPGKYKKAYHQYDPVLVTR